MFVKRFALAALVAAAIPAFGQESRGGIVGRVLDPSGAVIPGVTVSVRNQATNVAANVQSTGQGYYQVLFLNPGAYSLTASAAGFKAYQKENLEVRMGDRLQIDIVLEVGNISEKVIVSAETPLLEIATANVGQVIDNRRILELPMPHGSARTLFFVLGGVSLGGGGLSGAMMNQDPSRPAASSWLVFNGAPMGSTEITLDGVPNTQTANADRGSGMSNQPPVDAIQELKLETAYDASVGHTSGAHVNMIMKSGTNEFHGTGYFFYRNPALNASSFLGNRSRQAKPSFDYKRLGGSVQGPVLIPTLFNGKDRTFFSFAYERMDDKANNYPFVGTVPALDHRKGDFSGLLKIGPQYQIYDPDTIAAAPNGRFSRQPLANNIVPASRIDPIAVKMMAYWPNPNIAGLADGTNNFATQNLPTPNLYHNVLTRIDHVLTEKHRMYGRYVQYFKTEGPYRDYFQNGASGKIFRARPFNIVLDDTFLATPTLVIDMRYGYQRFGSKNWYPSEGFDLATLGFSSNVLDQLKFRNPVAVAFPGVNVSNIQPLQGEGTSGKAMDDIHSWFVDVNRPAGNHSLKFGTDVRVNRKNMYDFAAGTPRFQFTTSYTNGPLDNSASSPGGAGQGMAAFLLGRPTGGNVDNNDSYAIQNTYTSFYVQDAWRVRPNLTITMGVRYEYEGPMTERYNRSVTGFDPAAALAVSTQAQANYAARPIAELPASQFVVRGGVLFAGSNGRGFYAADKNNIAPRIGFSWNPLRDTVLRGGYGLYYLGTGITARTGPFQTGYNQATSIIPSNDNGLTFRATLSNPFPDGILTPRGNKDGVNTYVGRNVSFYDTDFMAPYNQRWNMNVQQVLPGKFLVEAGYAGSRVTRLRVGRNIAAIPNRYLSTLPTRDQPLIDRMSAQVPSPFYPLLPGTSLSGQNISVAGLLSPYPQFPGGASTTTGQGFSWYHSLQSRVERRFSRGFTVQFSYTLSKLMEASSYLNAADPMPYRTISLNDRPHHIGMTGIYELPFGKGRPLLAGSPAAVRAIVGGWQLGFVYNYWSGSPIGFGDVIFNGDIKNIPLSSDRRSVERWFNVDAGFERTPARQLSYHLFGGPLYYSGLRSDSMNLWDISVLKQTDIGERFRIQFRAEALNAFNHANFGVPNTTVTSSAFGQVTSEITFPRYVQFGFKAIF